MKSTDGSGFLDIHSHILPGLDDGPENDAQCISAARRYMDIGVDCVIATPHCIHGTRWAPAPDRVMKVAGTTEKTVRDAGIPLRILPGMEIAISDLICGNFRADRFVSLADKGVFLIEFPLHTTINTPTEQGIQKLLSNGGGLRFVIAHPERCAIFHGNIGLVRNLVGHGMFIQVNTGSVLGLYGRREQQTALDLFAAGLVHFLATDSHARDNRMPPDPRQIKQLSRILGEETLQAAFGDNPRRLLKGEAVLPVPAKAALQHPRPAGGFMQRFRKIFP
jgi:protein-tyrosine phosphatase